MPNRMLGRLWSVSALTLGGGGVGQLWGPTTREECIATVRTAVECGITLLDMAPAYGNGEAESVVGAAFDGRLPAGIRVTTKHRLGTPPAGEVEGNIMRSLDESLARMRLERVDLFFLHSNIIPDDYDAGAYVDRPATRWTTYVDRFVPVCERLVADGRIGAWGITGIGIPECVLAALDRSPRPAGRAMHHEPARLAGRAQVLRRAESRPRDHRRQQKAGAGVLGIRPVQGGALTEALDRDLPADHGVVRDFKRGGAFRALARELGTSAAALAHRYALSMADVDTVVLGCKNRNELLECVAAAEAGPLEPALIARIDAAFVVVACPHRRRARPRRGSHHTERVVATQCIRCGASWPAFSPFSPEWEGVATMLFAVVLRPGPPRLAVVCINGGHALRSYAEPLATVPTPAISRATLPMPTASRARAAPDPNNPSRAHHRGGQASCGTLPALLTYLPSRAIYSLITLSPARTAYCGVAHRLPRTFCWEFLGDTS